MKISGIAQADRATAAALYWQAFGGKLGRVLGPDQKALTLLSRVMRTDHGLGAYHGETLVGLVGFKTSKGALVDGTLADFCAVYGAVSGTCRALLLGLLERDVDNTNFLLDGICVDAAARSQGVGTALLAALEDEARTRHYTSLRLDVIDSNPRARALYERLGFTATGTTSVGIARPLFGFKSTTTMIKEL